MTKHRWDKNPTYRKWVKLRDRGLEDLHTRAQLEAADVMRGMITHVLLTAKAQFHGMKMGSPLTMDWFEHGIKNYFLSQSTKFYDIATKLRQRAYTLANASESEILAQLKAKPTVTAHVSKARLMEVKHRSAFSGGQLQQRITMYLDRLRRKVASYAQQAALTAKDETDFARDVYQSLPKARVVNLPRRILKPQLMESEYTIGKGKNKADVAIDMIDQDAWDDMLDAYKTEYELKTRAPEFVIGAPEVTGQKVWYAWEFERDMTNEFVQAVRDGQIDAANDNGITDFVWIAVIDDRTDECCTWRDGLLVSEIETQLGDHEDEDDACDVGDGLNPPIHFNCRCTLAPATDNMPEVPDDGKKEFDEWLDS